MSESSQDSETVVPMGVAESALLERIHKSVDRIVRLCPHGDIQAIQSATRMALEPVLIGTPETRPILPFFTWSQETLRSLDITEQQFGSRYIALLSDAATVGADAIVLSPITERTLATVYRFVIDDGRSWRRPVVDAFLLQLGISQEEIQEATQVPKEDGLQTLIIPEPRIRSDTIASASTDTPLPSNYILATALRERMPGFNGPTLMDDDEFPDHFKKYGIGHVSVVKVNTEHVEDGIYEAIGRSMAGCVIYKREYIHCVVTTATEWIFLVVVNTLKPDGEEPLRQYYRTKVYEFVHETDSAEIKQSFEEFDDFMNMNE